MAASRDDVRDRRAAPGRSDPRVRLTCGSAWRTRRDSDAQQCLDALDYDFPAAQQNLANANSASQEQRHVEVDERGRPVDPRDRAKSGSRLRPRNRLDVLLDEVQDDLRRRERQPDRGEPSGG